MHNEVDPVAATFEAMREAGVDMDRQMEFRFACDVTDVAKAYDIVRATRMLGYDAAIEVFEAAHPFDAEFARERTDMTQRQVPFVARAAMGAFDLASRVQAALEAVFGRGSGSSEVEDHGDDADSDDLIWISFVVFICPNAEAIAEVEDNWNAVLARYGARCDGWEVDPNNMVALEAA